VRGPAPFLLLRPLTHPIYTDSRISSLVVVGLATDYCVRASVLAALEAARKAEKGWEVLVVREGVRGVFAEKEESTLDELEQAGARVVSVEGEELKRFWRS
jgi:nicotinamidase-related amidase